MESKSVTVRVLATARGDGFGGFVYRYVPLMPLADSQLQFASLDFQGPWEDGTARPLIPPGAKGTADIQFDDRSPDQLSKFWAMVSVTNNDTQQVTIFTP